QGERRVEEVRLGEAQADVAPNAAEVGIEDHRLAAPEQVALRQPDVEQKRLARADAGARGEGTGVALAHVDDHVRAVLALPPARRDVGVFEKAEPPQSLLAAAPPAARKRLRVPQL